MTVSGDATSVSTVTGPITLRATNGYIQVDENVSSMGGNIAATAGTSIAINQAAGTGGSITTTMMGTIDLTAGTNITVSGDVNTLSTATGHINLTATGGYIQVDENIVSTGGNITGVAGGAVAINQGAGGGGSLTTTGAGAIDLTAGTNMTVSGDTTSLSTVTGPITLRATNGYLQIDENVVSLGGNIIAIAATAIDINQAAGTGGSITTTMAGVIDLTAGTNIALSGDAVTLQTAMGNIGLTATNGYIQIDEDIVTTAGGSVTATAGTTINIDQEAGGGGSISTGTGAIRLMAGTNLFVSGDSSTTLQTTTGPIILTATVGSIQVDEDITTMGGSATFTAGRNIVFDSAAGAGGSISTMNGDITLTAGKNIQVDGDAVTILTTGGNINLTADNNLNVLQDIQSTSGTISTLARGDTYLSSATISTQNEILMLSNLDMLMDGTATITSTTAGVTLVVDNAFPNAPQFGDGHFSVGPMVQVASGAGMPLRIFTAQQRLNGIDPVATFNGATFTPGPYLTNSATEQWATYYNSAIGGTPFTIFYKE